MTISLAILLSSIATSILVSGTVIITNIVYKSKNEKLEFDLNSSNKKLDIEKVKNAELYETLEYIRKTGKVPEKVMNNEYIFQNYLENDLDMVKTLNNKFKVNPYLEANLDKEKIKTDNDNHIANQILENNKQNNR